MNKQELKNEISDLQDVVMLSESEIASATSEDIYIQASNDLKSALVRIFELTQQLNSLEGN